MTPEISRLISMLQTSAISSMEFIDEYFKLRDTSIASDRIISLINEGFDSRSADIIEEAITVINTRYFSLETFKNELCKLIVVSWHTRHEDIAMLLKEISDPSTVTCLYEATQMKLDYLDYDDTYQFARKCIKALSKIGNHDALEKLTLLLSNSNTMISSYAEKELNSMKSP